MKFTVIFSICVLVTIVHSSEDDLHEKWNNFKIKYNKQYKDRMSDAYRMTIFKQNLDKIEAHNELYKKKAVSYHMGINQFADLTAEEFLEFNRLKVNQTQTKSYEHTPYQAKTNIKLPSEVDWRYQGAVTEVKNQGSCGSCWSFSATGALEGQYFLKTGQLVSLSEQYLMDCSVEYGNQGCEGGWMDQAFMFVMQYGIYSEDAYPYEGIDESCRSSDYPIILTVSTYYDIPPGSESDLEAAVASEGPASVAVDASNWQFYAGGVFYDYECSTSNLNHGVLVVGYGTSYDGDYWLIKNSWGTGWGEGGYIKIMRNRGNHCGVASAASIPSV